MAQTVAEQSKRIQTCYKRDAQRIGQSFYTLGHAYNGMNYKYLNINESSKIFSLKLYLIIYNKIDIITIN